MSAKEEKIKTSLVRARQVIANKFRKLSRNRIMQEKELEVKYAPITNSINKLIKNKSLLHTKKSEADNGDDVENHMTDDDDDLISFNDENIRKKPVKVEPTDVKKEKLELESEQKMVGDGEYEVVRIYAPENKVTYEKNGGFGKNPPLTTDKIRKSTQKAMLSKRKSDRTNDYDAHRYHEDEQNNILISPLTSSPSRKRSALLEQPLNTDKIRKNTLESLSLKRKDNRKNDHDTHRFDDRSARGSKKRQTEIISPEDYDSRGNFIGLAAKRRKVEQLLKPRVKRKAPVKKNRSPKVIGNVHKNDCDADRSELTQKRKIEPKVTLSLEDYNETGEFMGLAPKRRKIRITEKKLAEIQRNRQKIKRKRIKYSGKGMEKKFIPYSENIVYEYYDDPNELVERLMLLVSSKSAGNSNHDQEINSILEELRERNIIH